MKKYKYTQWLDLGYTAEGKRIRKKVRADSKAELERRKRAIYEEYENIKNPTSMTFEKYYQYWLETYKSHLEYNSRVMYQAIFKHLGPLYHIKLKDISRPDLQRVLNDVWETPEICRKCAMAFTAIFKTAVNDGHISYNPATGLKTPKRVKKPRKIFTSRELDALRRADLQPMDRMFVNILYSFGLRPAEAMALMPSDFDLSRKVLTISKAMEYAPEPRIKSTKTNNVRVLPIPNALIPELKKYFDSLDSIYLFHGKDGAPLHQGISSYMWKRIKKAVNAELGGSNSLDMMEGFSLYTFRRTFATDLYYSGISIKKAAELMGHTDTKMIMEVYAQLDDERENLDLLKLREIV